MLEELRKAFKPPYQVRDVYTLFIVFFIMITIPLTVIQIYSGNNDNRSQAATGTPTEPTKPTAKLIGLEDQATVSGVVNLTVESSDQIFSVAKVDFLVNDVIITTSYNQTESKTFNSSLTWDTTKETNGEKKLSVSTTNSQGENFTSTPFSVIINNTDNQAPSLNFIQPKGNDYISGNSYKIQLEADDNSGIDKIDLYIDKKLVKEFKQLPYNFDWSLSTTSIGQHEIEAVAFDFVGNKTNQTLTIFHGSTVLKTD